MSINQTTFEFRKLQLDKTIGRLASAISMTPPYPARMTVYPWAGPPVPKNSYLRIESKGQMHTNLVRTEETITTGQTLVNVTFTNLLPADIPVGSRIKVDDYYYQGRSLKTYFVEHIHLFETGSTHGNDLLINSQEPGGGKYNHNAGTTLTSGSAYSNNWGTKFSVLNVPSFNCVLERIIVNGSSNGSTGEDWRITLWKKPINPDSSSSSQITEIEHFDFIFGTTNASYVHNFVNEPNEPLDANTAIIPSFSKIGTKQTSSTKHYADITLIFSFYIS